LCSDQIPTPPPKNSIGLYQFAPNRDLIIAAFSSVRPPTESFHFGNFGHDLPAVVSCLRVLTHFGPDQMEAARPFASPLSITAARLFVVPSGKAKLLIGTVNNADLPNCSFVCEPPPRLPKCIKAQLSQFDRTFVVLTLFGKRLLRSLGFTTPVILLPKMANPASIVGADLISAWADAAAAVARAKTDPLFDADANANAPVPVLVVKKRIPKKTAPADAQMPIPIAALNDPTDRASVQKERKPAGEVMVAVGPTAGDSDHTPHVLPDANPEQARDFRRIADRAGNDIELLRGLVRQAIHQPAASVFDADLERAGRIIQQTARPFARLWSDEECAGPSNSTCRGLSAPPTGIMKGRRD
jgi:hypothetical protein